MKNLFKKISIVLIMTLIAPPLNITYASSQTMNTATKQQNPYDEEKIEIVNIEGVQYKYQYGYENGNKMILITNNSDNKIDKIIQNKMTGNIYLNDEIVISEENEITQDQSLFSTRAYYKWETKSSSNSYISWGKATSAAALAGMIAIKVGTLGPQGVIAAMGIGALSVIIAQCAGGRVYTTIQMYQAPFTNPQYRTIWGFKANTGDYYGDYIYHW